MSSLKDDKTKTPAELRQFAMVMASAFIILSGILFWRGRDAAWVAGAVALLFLLTGLIIPKALAPVERGWMWFGERMSVIMTFVLLTLLFFVGITPLGILLRLMGKDLLYLKRRGDEKSYWIPVEVDGPGSRYYRPF